MRRAAITLAEAQSFDRVAGAYDRLGDLNPNEVIDSWLEGLLPAVGGRALDIGCGTGRHAALLAGRFEQVDAIDLSGPMIDLARTRRPRPNITYRQADLHDVGGAGRYDFVLSLLTLHHVPDLHAALSHIKTLLAPGGRAALMEIYPPESDLRPQQALRRMVHRLAPRRPRLHALAAQKLSVNLVRRGPATAWELYRLSTRRDWLDHRRAIPLLENPSSATEMPSADVPGQLVHEDQDRPVTGSASASSPAPRARDRSRLTTSASANRAASRTHPARPHPA